MSLFKLFIAIRIPEIDISQWSSAQLKLKKDIKKYEYDVKWTLPGNYHVTLVFLGQTPEDKIDFLHELLISVAKNFPPFKLDINGMGAFASVSNARVLYLGVQNKKILRSLQDNITQVLRIDNVHPHNSEMSTSEYVPHLTVLRFRNAHSVKDLISPFLRKKWGEVEVSELILYKSEMRGLYPVYTPIFQVSLTGENNI